MSLANKKEVDAVWKRNDSFDENLVLNDDANYFDIQQIKRQTIGQAFSSPTNPFRVAGGPKPQATLSN